VLKVATIYGVAWLGGEMKLTLKKLKEDEFCFSALLLEEFINFAKKEKFDLVLLSKNGYQK